MTDAPPRLYADWQHQFNSELAILTSHGLAETTAWRIGPDAILGPPHGAASDTEEDRLAMAALLVTESLHVEVPEKSNIISLSYRSRDPALAQGVLDVLTQAYLDRHINVHTSGGSYDFFKEQHARLRFELLDVEEKVSELNSKLGIASLDTRRRVVAGRIATLETGIKDTQASISASTAKIKAMEDMLPGIESEPSPLSARSRAVFGQEAYGQIRQDLMREQADMAAQTARLTAFTEQLSETRDELEKLGAHEITLANLTREQALLEDQYGRYSERLEQARIDRALEQEKFSNIAIVQSATYPVEPEPANRTLKLGLALVLGLCGGIGLAFIAEYFDTSLRRPEDVEARLEVPTLVSIPHVEEGRVSLAKTESVTNEGGPSSFLGSHYDVLRERVLMAVNGSGQRPRLLAVTSAHAGEGVSTVAANLAITLARHGDQRVLFVDMNLGRPAANSIFGIQRGPGVAEILVDGEGNTATVEQNLYVLPAGQAETGRGADLMSQRFDHLLDIVRDKDYAYVVFDVPSVSEGTTTARLAGLMDGIILVTEAERVRWEVALRAKHLLTEAKGNLLGVVLNKRRYYVPDWLYAKL